MVCLKAHDKSSNVRRTQLHVAIVLLLFCPSPVILYQPVLLMNLYWHLIDLRIDFERICYYLIEKKTSIQNTFPWESTKPRPCMYLYCLD